MKKFLIILTVIIVIISSVFIYNGVLNSQIEITQYTVRSQKLPKNFNGYKIAFISDFHNSDLYNEAVQAIKTIEPDVIIFGGDMINVNESDYLNTKKLIQGIDTLAPIYMVTGNHEIFNPEWSKHIKLEFGELGVRVIDISEIFLTRGHEKIRVYGMQDPAVSDEELASGSWTDEWADLAGNSYDESMFNLLLCHRANYFPRLSQYKYDLILSGHMHGGLWRLPWVGGIVSPDRKTFFPEYTEGRYKSDTTEMIVSRGCDKDLSRARLFNPPEILQITLKCKD